MKKRFFAILLCLVMIVGLLPTGALAAQAADPKFTEVDTLTAGKEYVLAVDNGEGKVAAITLNGRNISSTDLSVVPASGSDRAYIETADTNVVWEFNSNNIFVNGRYLYPGSSGMATSSSSGRAVKYENKYFSFETSNDGTFYITFEDNTFGTSNDVTKAATFRLFEAAGCAHEHVTATDAKNATCTEAGNIAYWYCDDCGKYFSDKGLTEVISESATVTKALGHDLGEWTVEKEATTTATGTQKRVCSRCDYSETREYGPVATYKLTDTLVEGKDYLIVSANAGSAFALKNEVISSGSGYTAVNMMAGSEATITSDQKIQFADNTAVWTCGKNEKGLTLTNGTAFLTGHGGGLTTGSASDVASRVWSYEGEQLIITSSSGSAYVVYYSSGAKAFRAVKTSDETHGGDKVYLFVKDDACTHEGTETVLKNAKEASCTEEGYTGDTYCAVCGELIKEGTVIEKKAHTIELKDAKEATCTAEGYTGDEFCTVCKQVIKAGTVIEKKAHSFGDWVIDKPATEKEDGLKSRTCSACGFEEKAVIPKLDHVHTLVEVEAKAPTCTEAGHGAYWVCQGENGCNQLFADKEGKELIDAIPVVDALGHQLKAVDEVPAGCEKTGTAACWQCERCHKYFADEKGEQEIEAPAVIPAKGHSEKLEIRNAKDATCTEKGYTGDAYCPDCGKLITKGEDVAALGHKWGEWTVDKAATATEDGRKTRTCTRCDATESEVIPATGNTVSVKPTTDVPEESVVIKVGDTLTIKVTNGSSREAYDFAATLSNSGVAQIEGSATVNIAEGAEGTFTVKGLADGNVDITISNNNSYGDQYSRKAIIHLTVGEGGSVTPPAESTKFVEVSKLTADKEYVIGVKNSDGTISALTGGKANNDKVNPTTVTVTSGNPAYVETDNAALIWKLESDGNLSNNGFNFYPTSGNGVVIYNRDRVLTFAEGHIYFESSQNSNTYYVTFEDGAFGTSTDVSKAATFRMFERTDGSVTPPEECTHEKLTKHDATDSTCTEAGYEAYWECDSCGQLFSDAEGKNAIDKPVEKALAAHKLTKVEKVEATCAKTGAEEHWKCDVCGKLFSDADGKNEISAPVEIKKLDHKTELKDDKEPTCTEKGYTGDEVCSVCGEVVKKGSEIAALGHTPELKDKKEATCEERGYSGDYYCSVCGELIAKGNEVDALGHDWDDGVVTTAPTCTKEGVMTFTCKHDSKHTYTEPIDALGHDWSEWTVTLPATETEVGYEARTCSVCGERETRELPVLTHVHKLVAVAKVEPGCETAGSEACWQCEGCRKYFSDAEGKVEIEAPVVIAALGHDTEIRNAKEPTCAAEGYTGDTYCKRCGKLISEGKAIAKLAHQWGDWVETTPATETTEGVETRTCAVCGEKETRAIPVLTHVHVLVAVNGVAATCEDAGFEAYWKCSGCGKLFSDAEGKNEIEAPVVIAALGHDLVKHEAKEPTATEPGNIEYWECSECRKLFSDAEGKTEIKLEDTVIPATGEKKCDGGENCPSIVLTDVDRSAKSWYHEAVDWAFVKGIVTGTTPTTFSPKADCTREQMVTFLWRMNGSPDPKSMVSPFTDVKDPGHYAYKAILWAAEQGITNGTSATTFSPKNNVTREQVVTLLWRMKGSPVVEGAMQFTDVTTKDYSYNAVMWAVQEGITNGRTKDTFAPKGNCTRSEIVTFLWRYAGEPAAV